MNEPKIGLNSDRIPDELRSMARWIAWRYELRPGKAKPDKVPYSARFPMVRADVNRPGTWSSFDDAMSALSGDSSRFDGLGFMLAKEDNLIGVDLDDVLDEDNNLAPLAQEVVAKLNSYTEVSPSGRGLRTFVRGNLDGLAGRKRGPVEMYDSRHYFTVTGNVWPGCPPTVEDRQLEMNEFHCQVFGPMTQRALPTPTLHHGLVPDDSELLATAFESKSGPAIKALFEGDVAAHGGDHSVADLALVSHLAWWCNYDPVRIDRLFRRSGLFRNKWDERRGAATYGHRTITKVLNGRAPGDGYRPGRSKTSSLSTTSSHLSDNHSSEGSGSADAVVVAPTTAAPMHPRHYEPLVTTAAELLNMQLEPVEPVIDGLLVPGLNLLAGKPKTGKSWLALQFTLAVALGIPVLGRSVTKGDAVYFGLEDSPRRLQTRLTELMAEQPNWDGLQSLHLRNNLRGLDGGGFDDLAKIVKDLPNVRLVVIDTFARVKPPRQRRRSDYESDSVLGARLQRMAYDNGIALLLVTHVRKMPAEDAFDTILGSIGLPGTTDVAMVLHRRRQAKDAILMVTGRDVGEDEEALELGANSAGWQRLGGPHNARLSPERLTILNAVRELGVASPQKVATHLDGAVKPNTVRQLMPKMARDGDLIRTRHGEYSTP